MPIDRSTTHELLAHTDQDDAARIQYVVALKRRLRTLSEGTKRIYEAKAVPAFAAKHGHAPADRDEVTEAMEGNAFYAMWGGLNRSAQDFMWATVEDTIRRDMPRMKAAAARLEATNRRGSLTLDPKMPAPPDALAAEIHCQPGGYMRDEAPDDLMAGALYESGGNTYSFGTGIGAKDSKAGAMVKFLAERRPGFHPKRILDIGCSAGGASVAYADHFPDAEVHAVDAGPAMLRYAHARAESLGLAVHFHQMDGRRLAFPDGMFDLVVSHNLMHEVSNQSLKAIFAESRRVLAPGGIVLHQDVPIQGKAFTPFERFQFGWETRNNNEPFWDEFADADVAQEMRGAGFAADEMEVLTVPKLGGPGVWYVAMGTKPAAGERQKAA